MKRQPITTSDERLLMPKHVVKLGQFPYETTWPDTRWEPDAEAIPAPYKAVWPAILVAAVGLAILAVRVMS